LGRTNPQSAQCLGDSPGGNPQPPQDLIACRNILRQEN
jgi:hypothetical protein